MPRNEKKVAFIARLKNWRRVTPDSSGETSTIRWVSTIWIPAAASSGSSVTSSTATVSPASASSTDGASTLTPTSDLSALRVSVETPATGSVLADWERRKAIVNAPTAPRMANNATPIRTMLVKLIRSAPSPLSHRRRCRLSTDRPS